MTNPPNAGAKRTSAADKLRNFKAGPREVLNLEQFLRFPETKPPLEFLNGRVEQKVSPNPPHSILGSEIPSAINDYSRPRRLGRALVELRCSFGGESFVPDVSYFSRGHLPRDAKGRALEDVLIPPDLAVEILSPGETIAKLSARLARCVAKGVRLGWLIQPRRSRARVFRPGRSVEILELGGALDGEDVLPGFSLPLEALFGWLAIED